MPAGRTHESLAWPSFWVGAVGVTAALLLTGCTTSASPTTSTLQEVSSSGLTLHMPAGYQVTKLYACIAATGYNGTAVAYVQLWQFSWNAPSACPAQTSSPAPSTPPLKVPHIAVIPYSTKTSYDDLAKAAKLVQTRTAAGQTVDVETGLDGASDDTLLVFTGNHVGIDITHASPGSAIVAQLLDAVSK